MLTGLLQAGCGGGGDDGTATSASITSQPSALQVTAPAAAAFDVAASGTGLTYQWQRSTDHGSTFTPIAGATGTHYDAGPTDASMHDHRFRVVVTGSANSVTSSAAVLTVDVVPTIVAAPASLSVKDGTPAMFVVNASGLPAPALQWQASDDGGTTYYDIAGATSGSHTTAPTTAGDSGRKYRVVATNRVGSATSAAATLTVNPAVVSVAIDTSNSANWSGTSNGAPIAFQGGSPVYVPAGTGGVWNAAFSVSIPAGATAITLTLTDFTVDDRGIVYVNGQRIADNVVQRASGTAVGAGVFNFDDGAGDVPNNFVGFTPGAPIALPDGTTQVTLLVRVNDTGTTDPSAPTLAVTNISGFSLGASLSYSP